MGAETHQFPCGENLGQGIVGSSEKLVHCGQGAGVLISLNIHVWQLFDGRIGFGKNLFARTLGAVGEFEIGNLLMQPVELISRFAAQGAKLFLQQVALIGTDDRQKTGPGRAKFVRNGHQAMVAGHPAGLNLGEKLLQIGIGGSEDLVGALPDRGVEG